MLFTIPASKNRENPARRGYIRNRNHILPPVLLALLSIVLGQDIQAHPIKVAGKLVLDHAPQKAPEPKPASVSFVGKAAKASDGEIPVEIIRAVQIAEQRVQADPLLLLAIAWQESRFKAQAHNRHSSAQGFLQFTTSTWLCAVRDFGAKHGLAHYASAIKTDRDGHVSVDNARLRRAIMALRDDPELQAILGAEQLAQLRRDLEVR